MALHRSVVKYDYVLCEVNSEVSGDCETDILDSDIDVPTTDSLKKWQSCPLLFTSEVEKVQ